MEPLHCLRYDTYRPIFVRVYPRCVRVHLTAPPGRERVERFLREQIGLRARLGPWKRIGDDEWESEMLGP
jgi:hypothetical protein